MHGSQRATGAMLLDGGKDPGATWSIAAAHAEPSTSSGSRVMEDATIHSQITVYDDATDVTPRSTSGPSAAFPWLMQQQPQQPGGALGRTTSLAGTEFFSVHSSVSIGALAAFFATAFSMAIGYGCIGYMLLFLKQHGAQDAD